MSQILLRFEYSIIPLSAIFLLRYPPQPPLLQDSASSITTPTLLPYSDLADRFGGITQQVNSVDVRLFELLDLLIYQTAGGAGISLKLARIIPLPLRGIANAGHFSRIYCSEGSREVPA
jgi:hypothetical protein